MFYALICFLCISSASLFSFDCMYEVATQSIATQSVALSAVQMAQAMDTAFDQMIVADCIASAGVDQVVPVSQDVQEVPAMPCAVDMHYSAAFHEQVRPRQENSHQDDCHRDDSFLEAMTQMEVKTVVQREAQETIAACAKRIVCYSTHVDVAHMPHEFPLLSPVEQEKVLHIEKRYERSLNRRSVDLIDVHDCLAQTNNMRIWHEFVLRTRSSDVVQGHVDRINNAFIDFCQKFEQARTPQDFGKAFNVLQKIHIMLKKLENIKPACYVIPFYTYRTLHHIELPLLDLQLGLKSQLFKRDYEQIAWATQNHFDYMGDIFGAQPLQLPGGILKKVVNDHKNSWWWQRAAKNIKYAAVKYGYRDFANVEQKRAAYAQMLEEQKKVAQSLGSVFIKERVELADLKPIWRKRYQLRQQALDDAVHDSALTTQIYQLPKQIESILRQKSIDPQLFTRLHGNQLQQLLQTEYIKILKVALGNEHAMAESVIQLAQLGAQYNRHGRMEEAIGAADVAWEILDHIQAAAEGAYEAGKNVFDFARHPIDSSLALLSNAGQLCSQLTKMHCQRMFLQSRINVGDVNAAFDMQQFEKQVDVVRRNIVDTLAHMPSREYLKQGTKLTVEWQLMGKLFDAYGRILRDVSRTLELGNVKQLPNVNGFSSEVLNVVWDAKSESYILDLLHEAGDAARTFQGLPALRNVENVLVSQSQEMKLIPDPTKVAGLGRIIHEVKAAEYLSPETPNDIRAQDDFIEEQIVSKKPRYKDQLLREIVKFESKRFIVGNNYFLLDKSSLKHILSRHHPLFWDGSIKDEQSFFAEEMTAQGIVTIIKEVIRQNRDLINSMGTNRKYQIRGNIDGIEYVVGFKKGGKIRQFYAVKKV